MRPIPVPIFIEVLPKDAITTWILHICSFAPKAVGGPPRWRKASELGAGDSLSLGVGVNGHVQSFDPVPARYFAHGATVAFGYVDRAHLKKPARTDEGGWEMDEEVRGVREPLERQHWCRAKGLAVRYQIICPRVYGDGVVITTNVPVFRK